MEENVIQINGEIMIDVHMSVKKANYVKKNFFWNPATCSCENGKYLPSTIDDSAITCDEIIGSYDKEAKTIPKNFNEKKTTIKFKIYMFYLHFY